MILGAGIGLCLSATASGAAPPSIRDPAAIAELYGGSIVFDILRDGAVIGRQTVDFAVDGDSVVVKTVSDIAVKLLFITAYRFHYEAESRWHAGSLEELSVRADDDGKPLETTARRHGAEMVVDGPGGHFEAPRLFLGEHWDPDEVRQTRLLNSITGKLDEVRVTDAGPDLVQTAQGPHAAERYVYTGDLQLTAWYDSAGRWVGLRFKARDGSTIDYRCRRCGIDRQDG
jgi:hypothetical protein